VFSQIKRWWKGNQQAGRASVLFAYAVGKAQRLIAGLNATLGPILTHGSVYKFCLVYREEGVNLPHVYHVSELPDEFDWSEALIVAPPSAQGTPWMRRFAAVSTAFASGWMMIRGMRRRRSMDRGFVLSDHADWEGLMDTIIGTGAETVWVTHGYTSPVVRALKEQGISAIEAPGRPIVGSLVQEQ
jgi:putative mRNA 3-end processing factor